MRLLKNLSAFLIIACASALVFTLVLPAPTPTRAAAQAVTQAVCVLTNGNFEGASFDPWYLQLRNGAQGTLTADTGTNGTAKSARIVITQLGANPWDAQYNHPSVALVTGKKYALSFWARASSARTIALTLQQFDAPFIEVWTGSAQLTTAWQQFNIVVDYPFSAVTTTPIFRFNLGQSTGTVWIDEVSLCEDAAQPVPTPAPVSPSCRVANGDFESGALTPWAVSTGGAAQATLTNDAGARSATSARVQINQSGSTTPDIRLQQSGVRSIGGAWTSIQFYAKSSIGQNMQVTLRSASGQNYWSQTVRLPDPSQDAAFKHYFFVFQPATTTNDPNAILSFDLGTNSGSIWIDAVHLCAAPVKFQDEFNGSAIDGSKWDHCKPYVNECGITAFDVRAWYKPANAHVSGGTLKMRTTKETNTICFGCQFPDAPKTYKTFDYASVYLQTNFHFTTQYGYVEYRAKMPSATGIWPAFWMLPYISPYGQWTWPPEIDILEFYSVANQQRWSWHTLHYNTATEFNKTDGKQYQHPEALSAGFHTYAVNWTPDEVIWYVDGMETFRSSVYAVRLPMHLILSMDVSGALAGPPPSDADLPNAVTEVDHVRVFNNGEAFAFDGAVPVPTPVNTPATTPGATTGPTPRPTSTRRPTQTPGPSPTPNPFVTPQAYLPSLLDQ